MAGANSRGLPQPCRHRCDREAPEQKLRQDCNTERTVIRGRVDGPEVKRGERNPRSAVRQPDSR